MSQETKKDFPKQQQSLPGKESEMTPEPEIIRSDLPKESAKYCIFSIKLHLVILQKKEKPH